MASSYTNHRMARPMDCKEMAEIKSALERLYDAYSVVVPIEQMQEHPFSVFGKEMRGITATIDCCAKRAIEKRGKQEAANSELEKTIECYCTQLGLPVARIDQVENVHMRREMLDNEMRRVMVVRDQIKGEVNALQDETNKHRIWLGKAVCSNELREISLASVNSLRLELAQLVKEREEREAQRQELYGRIRNMGALLKKEERLTYDESIGALERMANSLNEELEANKATFHQLLADIRKRELYMDLPAKDFEELYDSENLERIRVYDAHLKQEQARMFDSIFSKVQNELKEINAIFGLEDTEFPHTEEALDQMRDQINALLPKKSLYCEIIELIERRQQLLLKMTEFEKIASDPKRLFKSSFQLCTEEKFRNTAYPSLLKLEESIFSRTDAFEKNFGPFLYAGANYRALLRAEIDNRIINRTVFISRCDSPYRKRKQ